ncbi:MAG: 2-dehydro-3-deoxygalactonokinase [Nitratireductor sp.]
MQAACAIVDWGTSNFRLWLVDGKGSIVGERRSRDGMIHTSPADFHKVLEGHLQLASAGPDLPVMICGMAGSRQGWREAPYLAAPTPLRDLGAGAVTVPGIPREVRIMPGIAQHDPQSPDVMRGEETQLLGSMILRPASFDAVTIACMPGTHSKWVRIENGSVTGFSTFMTGELFGLAANHSILSKMIATNAGFEAGDNRFLEAVIATFRDPAPVANRLFSARSARLLGYCDDAAAAPATSGALIGLELAGATSFHSQTDHVVLIASGRLSRLYQAALDAIGIEYQFIDADDAVRAGLFAACVGFVPVSPSLQTGSSRP